MGKECYGAIEYPTDGSEKYSGRVSFYARSVSNLNRPIPPSTDKDAIWKKAGYVAAAVIGSIAVGYLAYKVYEAYKIWRRGYERVPDEDWGLEMPPINNSIRTINEQLERMLQQGQINQERYDELRRKAEQQDQLDEEIAVREDEDMLDDIEGIIKVD